MLIGIDASRALRTRRTGTERYALEIIQHLLALPEAAQHQWRLYVDQIPPAQLFTQQTPEAAQPNVTLCHLPRQRLWTHLALGREIVQRRPDVLFIPAHVLPFRLPIQTLPASVVTIHDLGYHYFPAAHTRWQRLYLEWSTWWSAWGATHLIAVSQATANDLGAFCQTPAAKIHVVYEACQSITENACLEKNVTITQPISLTRPYALYVGTRQPRKNLPRLLQAYQKLWQAAPLDWDLVIAGGEGWGDEPLQSWAQDAGLTAHIHFVGYVAEAELAALYRGARFFCLPSLFEGFGLPVLEAQSYGVPVMTANNSSLPEIAGDAAILVDPTDIEAIADAMLRLSQDEGLRQRLITAGYANVKRFSWEKAARQTLAVLLSVAKPNKG